MRKAAIWRAFIFCVAAAAIFPAVANEAGDRDTTRKLTELRARLATLQVELNETRGRRDAAHDKLRDLERRTGELVKETRKTARRQQVLSENLVRLRREVEGHERERTLQRQRIATELRAAYALGLEDRFKLALHQDDPARLARLMTYQQYLQGSRVEQIAVLRHRIESLAPAFEKIDHDLQELATLRATQDAQQASLEELRGSRARVVASLDRQVGDRAREIERLSHDRARLERLIAELRPMLPAAPAQTAGGRFGNLAGRLQLPVPGKIEARFNQPKGVGSLRWRGVFIAASEGAEVHAVLRGRVVYADWLKGFGLLLILDHGDGYMTLYAHNQGLFRSVGDWVATGEVVGLAGNTGDAPRSGLYFEIRHQGNPRDPLHWCVARAP